MTSNPARADAASQRLDSVRDTDTIVTLIEAPEQAASENEVIDLTVDGECSGVEERGFEVLAAGEKWADVDSD